ncbi:hypothetical protein HOO65_010003 [Ceratocystis lukuohia]|uniref:Uncharacterized protein n=1 Tax=Ceratocystis lukuohia TaxID=2019550 RepID=A0ABR4MQZ1_9PEZI
MWLLKFVQPLFMAALLSTQVIAGDKQVPCPHDLGLNIPQHDKHGWKEVTSSDGFFATVFIAKKPSFIDVSSMQIPTATFKYYEAVLSIWADQTGLSVRNLDLITYQDVAGPDMVIIRDALEILGYNPSGVDSVFGIDISKDSPKDTEVWNLLSTTSFAKDAVEICNEFQEMSNRYIESFRVGRYGSDKWVSIRFATKAE